MLVVLAITVILSSFFVVDQREQSEVLRFGKFLRIAGPGLHLKLPFVDRNFNVATQQVQKLEFGYQIQETGVRTIFSSLDFPEVSIMLTGDLNIVDVE